MRKLYFLLIPILILACSPVNKYRTLQEVTSWENDIKVFEQLDKTRSYPDNAILFAGSSSIRLWSTLEKDMAPYPVIQRGFGGSKLSDFAVYADRIVAPHPCSAIVLFIANDITGGEKDKSPQEVAALFKASLKIIRKSHPLTPVFWISVTPTPARWKAWPSIKEASELIREICEKQKNTYFINTDFAFLGEDGLPKKEYFRSDMLHLNPEGYKVWNDIIKNEMKKVVAFPKVEIIAHRGASYLAPENTVAAAKLAWELGADAVECDIHLSSDNKIMVSHDASTKRTTHNDYKISQTSSEILRTLDAGSFKNEKYKGEKIPFLEEIINTVPSGKELVIEIKCGVEVLDLLKKTLDKNQGDKKFTFIAFDLKTISSTKKMFPNNPCYWLCSDSALFRNNMAKGIEAGLDGFSLGHNIVNETVAADIKKAGLDLFTWTVDSPEEAKRLIAVGVKGITTNRAGWLEEQIGYTAEKK